jgi:hypothetical protein
MESGTENKSRIGRDWCEGSQLFFNLANVVHPTWDIDDFIPGLSSDQKPATSGLDNLLNFRQIYRQGYGIPLVEGDAAFGDGERIAYQHPMQPAQDPVNQVSEEGDREDQVCQIKKENGDGYSGSTYGIQEDHSSDDQHRDRNTD